MKKKLNFIIIGLCCVMLLSSCTLHFKGKEIELDTESKDVGIVHGTDTEEYYELAKIDILKNARVAKNTTAPD